MFGLQLSLVRESHRLVGYTRQWHCQVCHDAVTVAGGHTHNQKVTRVRNDFSSDFVIFWASLHFHKEEQTDDDGGTDCSPGWAMHHFR